MIFLSGATLPKELFPQTVRSVAQFLPLTHVVNVLQSTFRGDSFREYGVSAAILLGISLVCLTVGAYLYKRKSWA